MKYKKIKYSVLISAFFIGNTPVIYGQHSPKEQVTVEGKITIAEQGVFSTAYDYVNKASAQVKSSGKSIFYRNFHNDGQYTTLDQQKKGKAIFTNSFEHQTTGQVISGNAPSSFDQVEFNSSLVAGAFVLKNNIDITDQVDFINGIVEVDDQIDQNTKTSKGMMSFLQGAIALNPSNDSHVQGLVEKVGNDAFDFPIGDKTRYRKAHISSPDHAKDVFQSSYSLGDDAFFETRKAVSGVINLLNNQEYWLVEKSSSNSSDVLLTLSWDEHTTPSALLNTPKEDLHIVLWDDKQQMWVDQGGIVDVDSKQITTPTQLKQYGFFTLATVKTDWIIEGDVVIYNLVTANSDGMNDYFIIENINRFAQNSVEIYNRWGAKVFHTSNYDANGDGSENVFTGYSQGKGTVSQNKLLPSGTYYYIVSYPYTNQSGTQVIKKTGSLHLEIN